ncbi:DENN domain-containing protein 10 [Folsomia candida]|uniref:DENN domain-containing protein 10 n=1 Tax=Folsomia candida TaxID=158441 RepID=UPI000B8FFE4C|nr:DENN domain-containing protein 10 [Folsomia candida]
MSTTTGNEEEVDTLKLSSCHLVEVLADDSLLWTWSYPHLSPQLRTICTSKCNVILSQGVKSVREEEDGTTDKEGGFMMQGKNFHLDNLWFYVVFPVRPNGAKVSGSDNKAVPVKMVGVIVVAANFHKEMYESVGNVLYLTYMKTGDASLVLQQFLSLVVEGNCSLPKKKVFTLDDHWLSAPYDNHQIKEIILRFGLETILIYTALQKRKRIVVYHYDIDVLSNFTFSLPALSNSPEVWKAIYPWIDLNEYELEFTKNNDFYIMGCTVAGVESNLDLFDLFVNIPAAEISVAPHAREHISMNKTHKEMATFMVQLASSETTEDEVVASILKRNEEIKDKL